MELDSGIFSIGTHQKRTVFAASFLWNLKIACFKKIWIFFNQNYAISIHSKPSLTLLSRNAIRKKKREINNKTESKRQAIKRFGLMLVQIARKNCALYFHLKLDIAGPNDPKISSKMPTGKTGRTRVQEDFFWPLSFVSSSTKSSHHQ